MNDDQIFLRQSRIKSLLLDKEYEISAGNHELAKNGYWATDHYSGMRWINEAIEKEMREYSEIRLYPAYSNCRDEWRDVRKELPEKYADCLVYIGNSAYDWTRKIFTTQYDGERFIHINQNASKDVTHWKPLPAPPQVNE